MKKIINPVALRQSQYIISQFIGKPSSYIAPHLTAGGIVEFIEVWSVKTSYSILGHSERLMIHEASIELTLRYPSGEGSYTERQGLDVVVHELRSLSIKNISRSAEDPLPF